MDMKTSVFKFMVFYCTSLVDPVLSRIRDYDCTLLCQMRKICKGICATLNRTSNLVVSLAIGWYKEVGRISLKVFIFLGREAKMVKTKG